MAAQAHLRHLHMSAKKVRDVTRLMRGVDVARAESQLAHSTRHAARPLQRLLKSAVANARSLDMNVESLYIKEVRVNEGPMMKRFRPRAFGRAAPIRKRSAHVSIVLEERKDALGMEQRKTQSAK